MRRLVRSLRNEEGQTAAEFALVFPPVLVACIIIMNASLLYNTRTMTKYAAFCAARAVMVIDDTNEAREAAKKAAVLTLLPACRTLTGELQELGRIAQMYSGPPNLGIGVGVNNPGGMQSDFIHLQSSAGSMHDVLRTILSSRAGLITRWPVAWYRTDVQVLENSSQWVTVEVTHATHIELPVIRRLLPLVSGQSSGQVTLPPGLQQYQQFVEARQDFWFPIRARCRLKKGTTDIH